VNVGPPLPPLSNFSPCAGVCGCTAGVFSGARATALDKLAIAALVVAALALVIK
jgi:hypothetical protein